MSHATTKSANRISWTHEMAIAARSGEDLVLPFGVAPSHREDVEEGCVTYRLGHEDPNAIMTVTVWPDARRAMVTTNGDPEGGDYDAERGSVRLDDADELVLVHEPTEGLLRREAAETARCWAEQGLEPVRPGTAYRDWAAQSNVPVGGDWDAARDAVLALTGREMTDRERDLYAERVRRELWDLLPVEESSDR